MEFKKFTPEQKIEDSREKYLKETRKEVGEKPSLSETVKGFFGKENAPSSTSKVVGKMQEDAMVEDERNETIKQIIKENIKDNEEREERINKESEVFVPSEDNLKAAVERGYVIKGYGEARPDDPEIMHHREEKQQELLEYLKNNEKLFDVVRTLIDYIGTNRSYLEERMLYGGSPEVREWEREDAPVMSKMIKKEMNRLNINDEQVDEILSKIFISMPELFVASARSYPQEVLDENYKKILKGDYSSLESYQEKFKDNQEITK